MYYYTCTYESNGSFSNIHSTHLSNTLAGCIKLHILSIFTVTVHAHSFNCDQTRPILSELETGHAVKQFGKVAGNLEEGDSKYIIDW